MVQPTDYIDQVRKKVEQACTPEENYLIEKFDEALAILEELGKGYTQNVKRNYAGLFDRTQIDLEVILNRVALKNTGLKKPKETAEAIVSTIKNGINYQEPKLGIA